MLGLARSGWSFYFRLPNTHNEPFLPAGIYLGPLFQGAVFSFFACIFLFFESFLGLGNGTGTSVFLAWLGLAILTGFFHEDGLADTADGLGVPLFDRSESRLERARAAMKDSRLGSYGVCALAVLWISRYHGAVVSELPLVQLTGIVLVSRAAGLVLATRLMQKGVAGAQPQPGLAHHSLNDVPQRERNRWCLLLVAFCAVWGLLFFDLKETFVTLFVVLVVGLLLARIGERNGKICGDTIGASICATELLLILFF